MCDHNRCKCLECGREDSAKSLFSSIPSAAKQKAREANAKKPRPGARGPRGPRVKKEVSGE